MLTEEQTKTIKEIIKSGNNIEIFFELLDGLASYFPESIPQLINGISLLMAKQVRYCQQKEVQLKNALEIVASHMPMKSNINFIGTLFICNQLFPEGNAKLHSWANKKFFNQFVKELKQRNTVSLTNWAREMGMIDYITLVLKQNQTSNENLTNSED